MNPSHAAELELAVANEQMRLLVQQRADLPVNLLNASIVVATLWNAYPRAVAMLWLATLFGVIAARYAARRRYSRTAPESGQTRRWGWIFSAGAFATGCLWGLTASAIVVSPDPVHHIFIVFVLGGMMAGGIVSNAAYLPSMVAFVLPTILPVIVFLISSPDVTEFEMGWMLVVYASLLLGAGRHINRSITDNFRLRFGQGQLLDQLRVSEAAMAEAQRIAGVGSWEFDAVSGRTTWSAEVFRILGLDPVSALPGHETLLRRLHPDDVPADRSPAGWLTRLNQRGIDRRIVMDDGSIRWMHEMARVTHDGSGHLLRVNGTLQDITDIQRAADELGYRDRLLHAVMLGTGRLIAAKTLDEGMPEALRTIGECLRVDRVLVMRQGGEPLTLPTLCYSWQTPAMRLPLNLAKIVAAAARDDAAPLEAWRAPLAAGQPVIGQRADSTGALRSLMERAGNQSTLLVPIFVDARLWGNLGIDACTEARDWSASEIDTLNTFADITGSMILRNQTRLALEQSEERFRVLGATAQDGIIMIDGNGRIGYWNRAAERILGYGAREAIGHEVHEFIAPARYQAEASTGMQAFMASGQGGALGRTRELAARRKDGSEVAVEISLAGAQLGGSWEAIAILRDISGRKTSEDKLQFANLLLKTQMEASLDGILIVDAQGEIISFNQRFADIWNIPQAALVAGVDQAVLASVVDAVKDPVPFRARVQYLYDHPGEDSHDEFETVDGRSIERYTVTLYTPAHEYLARAWFFRDVSERKRAEAQVLRLARFDLLTGLANRGVFVEALQQAIANARRTGQGFSVLYLDLDHFKDVNDTLGHPVGDDLLKTMADRLRSNTRETDTVARFGGDEFAVVVADTADPAAAATLAEKLITALRAPCSVQGNDIHTGASIGIATWGAEAQDAENLLAQADVALYRAKAEGRGGYQFFTEAMNVEVQSRVRLGAELRRAVDAGQMFLVYQPQIGIADGHIEGVEAQPRWRHPRLGVIGPEVFMPVAEQIGIVAKLGHWVLWTACEQGRDWLAAGIAPLRIAIKISALQFKTLVAFEADIAAALRAQGTPPPRLELELTDSMLIAASRDHGEVLDRLQQAGVTIAIGDFGTGYSSLEYLHCHPKNRIKIARAFIANIEAQGGDAAVVKGSIGLAHELGIPIMAEGVETRGQFELLKDWGCREMQGRHFARPLDAGDMTRLLGQGDRLSAS